MPPPVQEMQAKQSIAAKMKYIKDKKIAKKAKKVKKTPQQVWTVL